MLSDTLADLQKKHIFKESLWQEPSSHEGDEGLTGAMEFQILSKKVQVDFLMFFYDVKLSVLHVLLQDMYFSKIALLQKASSHEGDEGLKGAMDMYFSKIALWQKASS